MQSMVRQSVVYSMKACARSTMLAQTETKRKAPFGNRNGRPDKSDGLDPQFAKLKKELTLA
jgi:hypothetical protein